VAALTATGYGAKGNLLVNGSGFERVCQSTHRWHPNAASTYQVGVSVGDALSIATYAADEQNARPFVTARPFRLTVSLGGEMIKTSLLPPVL